MTGGSADMLGALFEKMPPAWFRKVQVAVLMGAFARAFDVEPPSVRRMTAQEALLAFREFTAACMEAALVDEACALAYRARLGAEARKLGSSVRRTLGLRTVNAFRAVRFFYRGIDIELAGEAPGDVRFGPCSFARRYTPADCWLMSAFDEGFMNGMLDTEGSLRFACRLTEGAPCCRARFGDEVGGQSARRLRH